MVFHWGRSRTCNKPWLRRKPIKKWAEKSNQGAYLGWRVETGMMDLIGPFLAGAPSFIHLDDHPDV